MPGGKGVLVATVGPLAPNHDLERCDHRIGQDQGAQDLGAGRMRAVAAHKPRRQPNARRRPEAVFSSEISIAEIEQWLYPIIVDMAAELFIQTACQTRHAEGHCDPSKTSWLKQRPDIAFKRSRLRPDQNRQQQQPRGVCYHGTSAL